MQTLNEKLPPIPKGNAFHFMRLACCLIVIYEHAAVLCGAGIPCLNLRGMAVDVFFILSGFWVTLSYLKSISLKEYALKRIRRIFPQYAATVVLCAVLLASFSSLELCAYFSSSGFWKYLAANLCTLNFLHPSLPGVFGVMAVNGSLWTIKIELAFYMLLPAVIFLAHAAERKFDIGGGIVLVALYLLSVLWEMCMPRITEMFRLPSELAHQFPAFLSYFASGMLFVFCWERLVPRLKYIAPACAVVLAAVSVAGVPFVLEFVRPFCLAAVVMFVALKARPLFGIVKNDFSYGMYLVHYPAVLCVASFGVFEENPAFAFLQVLALSFFCAYLLNCFQHALEGLYKSRKEARP